MSKRVLLQQCLTKGIQRIQGRYKEEKKKERQKKVIQSEGNIKMEKKSNVCSNLLQE